MQLNVFGERNRGSLETSKRQLVEFTHISRDGLDVQFCPDFLSVDQATALFVELRNGCPWNQAELFMYGKRVKMPRLTCWYGDNDAVYTYSGIRNEPNPWTPELSQLKHLIESVTGSTFNSVLLNLYRDGNDYMSWHRDNEPELGPEPVIASVSLGASRRFDFRFRGLPTTNSKGVCSIDLVHGSLLVMAGETQSKWEHGIAKTRGVNEPRINLTFRRILPELRRI